MKNRSLPFIGFMQATGVAVYCGFAGMFFWKANDLFGAMNSFLAIAVFLILFITSALTTVLIALGYPIYLFWDKKQVKRSLKLIAFVVIWLAVYFFIASLLLVSWR